jgi:hypothetical protein
MTTKLTVTPTQPGYQRVSISGQVTMSETDAQGLLESGHKVVLRMWGEDPSYDDLLIGPYTAAASATPAGLEFHKELLLLGNPDLDEHQLFVGAQVVDPAGRRAAETG